MSRKLQTFQNALSTREIFALVWPLWSTLQKKLYDFRRENHTGTNLVDENLTGKIIADENLTGTILVDDICTV